MMKTLSQRRFVEYASYVVSDSDFDPHIAGHLESERWQTFSEPFDHALHGLAAFQNPEFYRSQAMISSTLRQALFVSVFRTMNWPGLA